MIQHADNAQVFDDVGRPHAIKQRDNGTISYAYDDDGNVKSIVGASSSQYLKFDSSNRLSCVGDGVDVGGESLCNLNVFYYDIYGKRLADQRDNISYDIYTDDSFVYSRFPTVTSAEIQIFALGDRIGNKSIPNAVLRPAFIPPFAIPSDFLYGLGILGLFGLIGYAARAGALILILENPAQTSVALVVSVSLTLLVPAAWAGGGGGPTYRWELSDPLGTGMILLDEDGERVRHTLMTPFGSLYESIGSMHSLRKYYGGHREHAASGFVYMNARWFDPGSGTFLSVDPLIANVADPQSHNGYTYVRNNPLRSTDPTGMCAPPPEGGQSTCELSVNGTSYPR